MAIATEFTPKREGANALPQPFQLVSGATGDVTIPAGHGTVYITKATAATDLALASPSSDIDGALLTIHSTTAAAHVVTLSSGTYNGGANSIATFDDEIGNVLALRALNGVWYQDIGGSAGVTLSAPG